MKQKTDVLILGGGVAGLSLADALGSQGLRSCVVNKEVEGAASPRAAGILDPYLEIPGPEHPLCKLNLNAFDYFQTFARDLERQTKSSFEFTIPGVLYSAANKTELALLKRRYVWQRKLRLPVFFQSSGGPKHFFQKAEPKSLATLWYPTIGKVIAAQFLTALELRLRHSRSKIMRYRGYCVERAQNSWALRAGADVITAPILVNAKGCWAGVDEPRISENVVVPIRGQIAIVKAPGLELRTILHSLSGLYIVPWPDKQYLMGSSVEQVGFRASVTRDGVGAILRGAAKLAGYNGTFKVIKKWAGLRPCSTDHMPMVGPVRQKDLFVFTGLYRSGILLGPYLGKLLANSIATGKMCQELRDFSPLRFTGKS